MAAVNTSTTPTPSSLTNVISSYAILPTLASWLSTLDLYHLGLTNRANFSSILESPNIFKSLSRHCLCDGRGLAKRQEFRPPYSLEFYNNGGWGSGQEIHDDEPIEVRLYNLNCDEADALPCVKCGINLCEECRYYPRERPRDAERRPHLNATGHLSNIMCLCKTCDEAVEKEVTGKFLNDLCDCEVFKRWICTSCNDEECRFMRNYFKNHSLDEGNPKWENRFWERLPSKGMVDHHFTCILWCVCGATVDQDTRPRCTWCKRRHLPESQWGEEFLEVGSKMPWIDDDPNYPHWVTDRWGNYPDPYPGVGPGRTWFSFS